MNLEPENFGYLKEKNFLYPEKNCLYPQKNLNIYPPSEILLPSCTCKNCSRSTCPCNKAGIRCCSFCTCQLIGLCQNFPHKNRKKVE